MNKGKWNGEQILNEEYISAAVSKQIDNNVWGVNDHDSQGYGYLFWRTYENSYFFNGMGCQYAVCVPDKDLIMVYNGDNQGKIMAKKIIFDGFFSMIADRISDTPLPEDAEAQKNLESAVSDLKLMEAKGACSSDYSEKINGVEYAWAKTPWKSQKCVLCSARTADAWSIQMHRGIKHLISESAKMFFQNSLSQVIQRI